MIAELRSDPVSRCCWVPAVILGTVGVAADISLWILVIAVLVLFSASLLLDRVCVSRRRERHHDGP